MAGSLNPRRFSQKYFVKSAQFEQAVQQALLRIPKIQHCSADQLRTLAQRARCLTLPPGRVCISKTHRPNIYLYLLEGHMILTRADKTIRIRAHPEGFEHFYPGCQAAVTGSEVRVLSIRADDLQPLCAGKKTCTSPFLPTAVPASANVLENPEPWARRFARSPLLQHLSVQDWQGFFSSLQSYTFPAGTHVITLGAVATCCYVLRSGRAVVRQGPYTVHQLQPGDIFGEDALITGRRRNAHVVAQSPVVVYRIDAENFKQFMLDKVVKAVGSPEAVANARQINVGTPHLPNAINTSLADIRRGDGPGINPQLPCVVVGGTSATRALACFLLLQRGYRAFPVIPIPQGGALGEDIDITPHCSR